MKDPTIETPELIAEHKACDEKWKAKIDAMPSETIRDHWAILAATQVWYAEKRRIDLKHGYPV